MPYYKPDEDNQLAIVILFLVGVMVIGTLIGGVIIQTKKSSGSQLAPVCTCPTK